MSLKRILIGLLLVLMVFPVFAVNAQTKDVNDAVENFTKNSQNTFNKIERFVKDKTPDFLLKPFKRMVGSAEGFRKSLILKTETRKLKVEALIEPENAQDPKRSFEPLSDEEMKQAEAAFPSYTVGFTEISKGFKYLEVFLLIILLFILSIPLFFYAFFVLAAILICRFFWFRIY
jgi:hypothetical protein